MQPYTDPAKLANVPWKKKCHQEFQVPKMEVLNLTRRFWGWGFPYISLIYSLKIVVGNGWNDFRLFFWNCPSFRGHLWSFFRCNYNQPTQPPTNPKNNQPTTTITNQPNHQPCFFWVPRFLLVSTGSINGQGAPIGASIALTSRGVRESQWDLGEDSTPFLMGKYFFSNGWLNQPPRKWSIRISKLGFVYWLGFV